MKLWKRRQSSGLLPGVEWPEPAQGQPASPQIIELVSQAVVFTDDHSQAERCANCGKCPRCGR